MAGHLPDHVRRERLAQQFQPGDLSAKMFPHVRQRGRDFQSWLGGAHQQLCCIGRRFVGLAQCTFGHRGFIRIKPELCPVEGRGQHMPLPGGDRCRSLEAIILAQIQLHFAGRDRQVARILAIGRAHAGN